MIKYYHMNERTVSSLRSFGIREACSMALPELFGQKSIRGLLSYAHLCMQIYEKIQSCFFLGDKGKKRKYM